MSADRIITPSPETEQPKFNPRACIEATIAEANGAVTDYFTESVPLAQKFFAEEVLDAPVGQIHIASMEDRLGEIKSGFEIDSTAYDEEIKAFGGKMIAHAEAHGVDYDLDPEQLEQYVEPFAAERIRENIRFGQGEIVNRGWHIYNDRAGHAVLLTYSKDNEPYLPAIKAVLLDDLFEQNPELVRTELRSLFTAGLNSRLKSVAIYELANHELVPDLVPDALEKLAVASAWERESIRNLLTLSAQFDEIGPQKMARLQKTGEFNNAQIPGDNRRVTLERSLRHRVICPSEPREARIKAGDQYQALYELQNDAYLATEDQIEVQGQEVFHDPLIHSTEFTGQIIKLEDREIAKAEELTRLIDRTGRPGRGMESTLKELKRRLPARFGKLERFKAELGESYIKRIEYDEFVNDVARDLRFAMSGSPIGEQVTDLESARDIMAKKLSMHITNLERGGEKWLRKERDGVYGNKAVLRDQEFADMVLYLIAKRMQQAPADVLDRGSASYQFAANKLIAMIDEKYSQKAEAAVQRKGKLEDRSKNFDRLNKTLGITKQTVALLVKNSRLGKEGERQLYDHDKFAVLYRTLAVKRQGLVDLKSPATRAMLLSLYPKLTPEDWALIGA